MRFLFKAIAIAGCVTTASAAHAVPFSYDEAVSGDIDARVGNVPRFGFDVGNNVIAGSQSFGADLSSTFDFDEFIFDVPKNSVLSFVTIEFGAFDFTGPLVAFGPKFSILGGLVGGPLRFIASSDTPTSLFTDVLSSIGPQNLFTQLPIQSGAYGWINGAGNISDQQGPEIEATSATWDYRLTFGVDRIAVPEPGTLALLSLGLGAVFLRRYRSAMRIR